MTAEPYRLRLRARVHRQLAGPPAGLAAGVVAAAAAEFVVGPLLHNPHRVGKPLRDPYAGQWSARCGADHRIRYEVDDVRRIVTVLDIAHRSDVYGVD